MAKKTVGSRSRATESKDPSPSIKSLHDRITEDLKKAGLPDDAVFINSDGALEVRSGHKPRLISKDTADSLRLLDEMVEQATKHLSKMPASREPSVCVGLDDLLQEHDDMVSNISYEFAFSGKLIVNTVRYSGREPDGEVLDTKPLNEYPTKLRIRIQARIPKLIERAKEAESGIKKMADEAIAEIKKAIEATTEDFA